VIIWSLLLQGGAQLQSAATAYTLDTTPGTYNLTGSSPSLLASRLVDTTPGAYDLTGSSPSLLLGRALDTTPGDYDITGSSPSLLLGRALDTTPGDYDITGSPVDLEKATAGQFVLQTTPGAYNITGLPVELIANIAVIGGGGPGKTAKRRGWANERARFEESLRTEEVAEQVKAAQRVLKKAQSESAQRLGELVTEYEAARASLDELREQVARIERESRIREEVEVAPRRSSRSSPVRRRRLSPSSRSSTRWTRAHCLPLSGLLHEYCAIHRTASRIDFMVAAHQRARG
jgi:hypothetical protein